MSQTCIEQALSQWRETRNSEALGELLKARRERAYSVAWHLTRSSSDAEDAVQEAFIKLLTRTTGFQDEATFEVTIYRAVVQCSLDVMRKRARRKVRELKESDGRAADTGSERVGTMHTQAAQDVAMAKEERAELHALLRTAVDELPEEERLPVVLCYYQGLTLSDSARTLELPRGTIRARLERALLHLKARLQERNRLLGSAAILTLLWQDGVRAVPESLAARLDQALPGRPCLELPSLAQPGPAATAPASTFGLSSLLPAALAATLLVSVMAVKFFTPAGPQSGLSEGVRAAEPAPSPLTIQVQGNRPGNFQVGSSPYQAPRVEATRNRSNQEEETMKTKLGAVAMLGGLLLTGAPQAGEPNAEVGKVIEQIEARRAAKAEAEAKMISAYQAREKGERGGSAGQESVRVIQPGSSSTGAPVVIEIKE